MTPEYIWSQITVSGPDECWEWISRLNTGGYGAVFYRGAHMGAHRAIYQIVNGPLTRDRFVLHSCDNRKCCNPSHLREGDHAENMHDRKTRGRNPCRKGTNNGRAKLTAEQVVYIRSQRGIRLQKDLAREFGITQVMVSKIQLRQFWQSVE